MELPIRVSVAVAACVIAYTTVGCRREDGPPPDVQPLVTAVARVIAADTGSRPLRAVGGRTAFDSLVAAELRRRGGRFVPLDDSVDVTRVETEGVSFRGDTAIVPVRWAVMCDRRGPGSGMMWYATWAEFYFVPQVRRGANVRAWRRVEGGSLRLEDGVCEGLPPIAGAVEFRPHAG